MLAFASAPALAAGPPESPLTTVPAEVKGSTAVLEGVVNPLKIATTSWFFEYRAGAVCTGTGGSTTPVEGPEETEARPVEVRVEGLTQDTKYTVCLVAENEAGEKTVGAPETFTTITPEPPAGLEAKPVAARTATLNGVLNPDHAGEGGTYEFVYKQSEGECTGEEKVVSGTATGAKSEPVTAPVGELLPKMPYTFCLRAKNEAGEEALSVPVTFTTLAAPPTIAGETVSGVEASAATLEAGIVPEGAGTTYHFVYVEAAKYRPSCAECEDEPANGYALGASTPQSASIGADDTEHAADAKVTGLASGTTYHYRVVATNAESPAGGTVGPDKTFTTSQAAGASGESCPNAARRAEQPFGQSLPECRAYEMVSPTETNGQDATEHGAETPPRAAVSGDAVVYGARGVFGEARGNEEENALLSRREPALDRWSTTTITPPQEPESGGQDDTYLTAVFSSELTEGIATTDARLAEGVPSESETGCGCTEKLYRANFAAGSYEYVGSEITPLGASENLKHVVFGHNGIVYEAAGGHRSIVSAGSNGEPVTAALGSIAQGPQSYGERNDTWNAVSSDGERVAFTTPQNSELGVPQLHMRVNATELQSHVARPEANALGAVEGGSTTVAGLQPIFSATRDAQITAGSTEVLLEAEGPGKYAAGIYPGQPVTAAGIPPGTTVVAASGSVLTISQPATVSEVTSITAYRPDAFTVGERIAGYGLPFGTTVSAVHGAELTLSNAADVSVGEVALTAGGECTEPEQACTLEVSASQRRVSDTHGVQAARYWAANSEGTEVFFTSSAELTEDAYTGPEDNAPNLYEYDVPSHTLTDLTVDRGDAATGAAVLGVAQVSNDGEYVYFVAKGALKGEHGEALRNASDAEPVAEEDNLYLAHDGETTFITTLSNDDTSDWEGEIESSTAGPETNTDAIAPGGTTFAFVSDRSLTGYDNAQAQPEDCEGPYGKKATATEDKMCREVYLYHAPANLSTESGTLVCASCNPTGERPVGPSTLGRIGRSSDAVYRTRNLTEGGRLFFDSKDRLVASTDAGATRENVYEYAGGQIHAISDPEGPDSAFFLDASASGSDVFFATAAQLVPQDRGDNIVVYDARVEGGFPATPQAATCSSTETCAPLGAPQPSTFLAPASATFSGPGNATSTVTATVTPKKKTAAELRAEKLAKALKGCRKDKKKSKRQSCEKQARAKYGPTKPKTKKAKKASNNRRGK
jgi:hypothetical protein